MRLLKFRVTDFRSVVDTGWVECKDVTVFAGDNESGKTTLFYAIMKLMPPERLLQLAKNRPDIHKIAEINVLADLPIDRVDEFNERVNETVFIRAEFLLTPAINAELSKLNPSYSHSKSAVISRNYGGQYDVDILRDFPRAVALDALEYMLSNIPVLSYYQEVTEVSNKIDFVTLALKISGAYSDNSLTDAELMFSRLLTCLDIWESNLIKTIAEAEITLNQANRNIDFRQVFEKVPLFKTRVEVGFERLNEQFQECWGKDDVIIGFESYDRGIIIKIIDRLTHKPYYLENRSTGFRRFFAHFLTFSITGLSNESDSILMFDEAGAAMHSVTQRKLADYFLKMGKHAQILYNTHSSYMIPVMQMNNVRVVYKDSTRHTSVQRRLIINDSRSNELSLFPIQSSLGLYIAEKALSGCLPIIVLTEADETYLSLIKNILIALGKFRSVFQTSVFSTGPDGIDSICEMFSDGDDLPAVFLSSDAEGKAIKERLIQTVYANAQSKILSVSDYQKDAEYLEDLIPQAYIELSAKKYIKTISGSDFQITEKNRNIIPKLLKYAEDYDIILPMNFRYEIAKRVKLNVMSFYKDVHISFLHSTRWIKIWKDLIRLSE
ncbi:MAG: ATP-binding protein [Christensenellaceae bacterium]|jgi:energy-coupling factor transporter ATP-binding protein EcfA2|nr:ATP-binding protein [Christensenellaceae bacterium]